MRKYILAIVAIALLVAPSTAAACKVPVREPAASITICGDPRAYITLENDGSNVASPYRIVFWTPRTDERKVIERQVAPGDTRTIVRWVHGGNRNVAVYDGVTGDVLARVNVAQAHSGPCVS